MDITTKLQAIREYKDKNPDATIYAIRQEFKCSPTTVKKALSIEDQVLLTTGEKENQGEQEKKKRIILPRADVRQFRSDHPDIKIADIADYFGLTPKQIERCLYTAKKQEDPGQEDQGTILKPLLFIGAGVLGGFFFIRSVMS
jgi:AraC-like DNA-binding protein